MKIDTKTPIHIISLGAGVQSSCMALMAAHGELERKPMAAVFADTQHEPRATYKWLDELEKILGPHFPVYRVTAGSLKENVIEGARGNRWASLPAFTQNPETLTQGQVRRQCTKDFKLMPLSKKQRELAGLKKGQRSKGVAVVSWIGISTDEMVRATPSTFKWQEKRFPLIEAGMSRQDCLSWMRKNGYPEPPKSSCTFCPYHNDGMWRDIKLNDPEAWQEALEVDAALNQFGNYKKIDSKMYLHRSCKPLAEVDLSNAEDRGQMNFFQMEDCIGLCGV